MFMFHAAFSLGLIALTAGTALFVWSKHVDTAGSGLAKAIGTLVIIFAIGSTLCTIYYGIKYWQQGDFQSLMGMHSMMEGKGMPGGMMNMQGMMDKCMADCKTMSGGMMNPTNMNNSDQTKNHASHHSQ